MEARSVLERDVCQRRHGSQCWPLNRSAEKLEEHKDNT